MRLLILALLCAPPELWGAQSRPPTPRVPPAVAGPAFDGSKARPALPEAVSAPTLQAARPGLSPASRGLAARLKKPAIAAGIATAVATPLMAAPPASVQPGPFYVGFAVGFFAATFTFFALVSFLYDAYKSLAIRRAP